MTENINTQIPAEFTQNAVMVMDNDQNFIADLTTATQSFCSMEANTPADKAKLFKAMNNPDKRIGDCINTVIKAKDMYCEVVRCTNKETGEVTDCPRIVLIDIEGTSYQSVSIGVYSAMKKVIQVFGSPTWEKGLSLMVKQISKGDRKLLTFDVVA